MIQTKSKTIKETPIGWKICACNKFCKGGFPASLHQLISTRKWRVYFRVEYFPSTCVFRPNSNRKCERISVMSLYRKLPLSRCIYRYFLLTCILPSIVILYVLFHFKFFCLSVHAKQKVDQIVSTLIIQTTFQPRF